MQTTTVTTSGPYTGNGATTQFPVTFKFAANSELLVYLVDSADTMTLQTITTHYTVSGSGNPTGGTVTMLTAPTSAQRVFIMRQTTKTQATDYRAQGPWLSTNAEASFDRLTRAVQEVDAMARRGIRMSALHDSVFSSEITGELEPYYIIRINAAGTGVELVEPSEIADSIDSVDGTGTLNYVPIWTDTNTLADSIISQNVAGTLVTVAGNFDITGIHTAGSLSVDTSAAIGTTLDVAGASTLNGLVAGATILDSLDVTNDINGGNDGTFDGNLSAANLSGTNTGDQTTIVGIAGTMAEFDTACSDGNFAYQSQAATFTTLGATGDTTFGDAYADRHKFTGFIGIADNTSVDWATYGAPGPRAPIHIVQDWTGSVAKGLIIDLATTSFLTTGIAVRASRGTNSAPTARQQYDNIGSFDVDGYNSTTAGYVYLGGLRTHAEANESGAYQATQLTLWTHTGTATGTGLGLGIDSQQRIALGNAHANAAPGGLGYAFSISDVVDLRWDGSTSANLRISQAYTGSARPGISFYRKRGTHDTPSVVVDTDELAQESVYAYANAADRLVAYQLYTVDGALSGSNVPVAWGLYLGTASGGATVKVSVSNAGNMVVQGTITASNFSGTLTGTNTGDQTITLSGDASGSGTSGITVTLATVTVPKGGTGLTSGTSGGIPYFSASNTMASSAALGSTHVVLGGGAGAAPNASSALLYDGLNLKITNTQPGFAMSESDAAADNKLWLMAISGGVWNFAAISDDLLTQTNAISITRSDATISEINLAATTISHTGAATFSSTVVTTGALTVASDTDATTILGRVRIDARAADRLYISHIDYSTTANYALQQHNNGTVKLNTATGTTLALCVNDNTVGAVSSTGITVTGTLSCSGNATLGDATTDSHTINGNITQSSDTDRTNIFGRVRIDSRVSDNAYFSHYDMSAAGQQALVQSAAGATTINAASGQAIAFAVAGTPHAACDSSGNWQFGAASTNTITMTGRFFCRQVTDAGPMTATGGTIGEIVFNTSNNKWYGCTVTHATAATWSAFN